MAGNLLSIGKSGLFAAQVGLSTTGHNISNANVAGYSRQGVVQSSATAQNFGYGFVGSGTQIAEIKRYSDGFMNTQVNNAIASKGSLDAYFAQISQIDNLLADTTSGLSPALQNFFAGLQDMASDPSSVAARQAVLSNAESLASRFGDLDGRLSEVRDGVNSQITTKITLVNSYASQIADLNDKIGKFSASGNGQPNDMMDARDQLVASLNKEVKATVVRGDNNSMTISIGNGMPLVVGAKAFQLAPTTSPTDQTRVQVGYVTGTKVTVLGDNALPGGELGGLLDFRANTLDRAQNSLGRIAIGMAETFNAQHRLGQDSAGNMGGDFFTIGPAVVGRALTNNPTSTADVKAAVVDSAKLTHSDYKVTYDNGKYVVTRMSDQKTTDINPFPQTQAQVIDGVAFDVSGSAAQGDYFVVRPTIAGAANFNLALTDISRIAAGAPVTTGSPLTNSGTGKISEGKLDQAYLQPGNAISGTTTLNYTSAGAGGLTGFPATQAVTVTNNGVDTVYPAGTSPIPFVAGANYNFGGINISFTGKPAQGDSFTVGPTVSGTRDNRNARLLGDLQTKTILENGSATYQGAYAELVSFIGNKTREVEVNGKAGDALLNQVTAAQQSVSGVNLDEEASNLLKYQQAYQAAGKVMQIAGTLFDTLLSIR